MTSDYVIMSIKLCPVVGNNEYIIVCDFVSRRMSGFEVVVGVLEPPTHTHTHTHCRRKPKKPE